MPLSMMTLCGLLGSSIALAAVSPPPPDGTVEFMGVQALATLPDLPDVPAVEVYIKRKRFNELRDESGLDRSCDANGLVLEVVSGPLAEDVGVFGAVRVRLFVLDADFGGPWEQFCDNEAFLFATGGECPEIVEE